MSIVRFHSLVHQFNISLGQASRKTLRKTLNKTPKFRPHYWSFMRRIHWWPRESPPKGPAMRKALIMQFQGYRSSFVSSIYIYINISSKLFYHISGITQASVDFITTGNSIVWSQTVQEKTGGEEKPPVESHPKGQQSEVFIMQFQYFRSAHVGKANYTQQGEQMSVLGCHLTSNSTFCSIAHTGKMQENINIPHYWSLMRRIHWWPMDSPHKGPAMQK